MSFTPTVYSAVYFAATGIALAAAVIAWRRRSSPGAVSLLLMVLAAGWWSFFDALETAAVGIPAHVMWNQVAYLGSMSVCTLLLLFALDYTGRRRLPHWATAALFVVPALGVVAAATNELHHLIWTGFSVAPGGMNLLVYEHGWLFWALTLYNYTVAAIATVVLISFAMRAAPAHRRQSVTVIVAVAIPWAAGIAYDLAPGALPGVDPAVTLAVSGMLLSLSLVRYGLLDLTPVARDKLIERMSQGLIVLDAANRVMDSNPAAGLVFAADHESWIGRDVRSVLSAWPEMADHLAGEVQADDDGVTLVSPSGRSIAVTVLPLLDRRGRFSGSLITLRDATGQVEAEASLHEMNADLHERIHQIEELQEELREQAIRDPLTGLFNRRYLTETLRRELGRAAREGYPVSIVMIDIDAFKDVNDAHGHAAGDQSLRFLGARLRAGTRPGDIACRFGGDEFLMVLPNTSVADAATRAEEWREGVSESSVYWMEWAETTTISLGVAGFPDHGSGADEVMSAADAALYEAKRAGRDRVVVSSHVPESVDPEPGPA